MVEDPYLEGAHVVEERQVLGLRRVSSQNANITRLQLFIPPSVLGNGRFHSQNIE
jgi:hypothetical protein